MTRGSLPGDDITNVRQPRLTGKAEPGSTVQVVDGLGKVDGSAMAAIDGTFTVKLGTSLVDGTYSLAAKAIDPAGNVGPLGPVLSLDDPGHIRPSPRSNLDPARR